MRWLLGLVGALLLVVTPASSLACPGDCTGNGVVSIDELVTAVRIALAQSPPGVCRAADDGDDGRVTVDDLVRAVNAALRGCPPTPTATVTASPSLAPPTETPSITVSATPTGEATATITPSVTPSPSTSPTASVVPTSGQTATPAPATATPSVTVSVTSSPTEGATPPSTSTSTSVPSSATGTPSATPSTTGTASPSPTASATRTRTATATASPSSTPIGGPLGTRRFSLDPATSAFVSVLASDMQFSVTGFTGYIDLQAGAPDLQTGRAIINVTAASPYLQLVSDTGLICIKPLVPVVAAGIVDCDGGTNLAAVIRQDHRIGVVGDDGFMEQSCTAADGAVEPVNFPHPQVCNGPLTVERSANGDSGPGAVAIAPDPTFAIDGLPAEVTFEQGLQCTGNTENGFTGVFVLISSDIRTEILHVNDTANSLVYDNPGENFSCPAWAQENGPGQLILSFPTLHGFAGADVINVFVFDD